MELTIADCKRIIFWYHVAFQTQELSPEGEQEPDLRFLPELQADIQDFEKNHGKIARFLPELREPSNGDKMPARRPFYSEKRSFYSATTTILATLWRVFHFLDRSRKIASFSRCLRP